MMVTGFSQGFAVREWLAHDDYDCIQRLLWNPIVVHLSCGLMAFDHGRHYGVRITSHAWALLINPRPEVLTNFAREAEADGCAYGVTV